MAFYNGYIDLPTDSYESWKAAVAGNGYNADGFYGDQCWDLVAEFWWNIGFPQGYPLTGPNEAASECWSVNRLNNISYNGVQYFDLIENAENIKKGDVVVFDGIPGHIGFADADYSGGPFIYILGQNQGSIGVPSPIPNPDGGTTATVSALSPNDIIGAFRYLAWNTGPTKKKKNFPWVLYARKLNQRRNGM